MRKSWPNTSRSSKRRRTSWRDTRRRWGRFAGVAVVRLPSFAESSEASPTREMEVTVPSNLRGMQGRLSERLGLVADDLPCCRAWVGESAIVYFPSYSRAGRQTKITYCLSAGVL